MIVLSNPTTITNEINVIHSLFEEGLQLFHVRKPSYSLKEMISFVAQINPEFRPQLVLHSHHELVESFKINRIHFTEEKRKNNLEFPPKFTNLILSTSTHSISDFNSLTPEFEYAFLSPVYPSISKENYLPKTDLFEAIKDRTNTKTKLIALGGINPENIEKSLTNGFDNVALLGTIWNAENPIKNFKSCQRIALSYLQ
ncbi:thiamine phosphate synthase [Flavobacterium hydatis]|uniref:Thiamine monophosphate synthase n=1 Tax=Flavobacterium hydatis TaxID=991 RepID=A0A086AEX5_FLAHY|nr:thiamine phosphate synthase [Flavobacterium hydatis]KFF15239.1 thiamine monophosphate synthase [Flavobacterium hydatis]OXA93006.1 thiamine phosphate synthase [Flavobacterium hydatis]